MTRTRIAVAVIALAGALASNAAASPIVSMSPTAKLSALWVGDSYTAGAGSTQPWKSAESYSVSRMFGWSVDLDAIGGTGFVAPSKYGPPIPTRLSGDEAKWRSPAYVVIDGGRNDHGSLATETQAVTAYFNAVSRAYPRARVVVITPFIMRSAPTDYLATRCLLEQQAVSRGWSYVDPLSEGWVNTTAAQLVAADGVHPDTAGYAYIAENLMPELVDALAMPGDELELGTACI